MYAINFYVILYQKSPTIVSNEIFILGWPCCSVGKSIKGLISLLFLNIIVSSLIQFIISIDYFLKSMCPKRLNVPI